MGINPVSSNNMWSFQGDNVKPSNVQGEVLSVSYGKVGGPYELRVLNKNGEEIAFNLPGDTKVTYHGKELSNFEDVVLNPGDTVHVQQDKNGVYSVKIIKDVPGNL